MKSIKSILFLLFFSTTFQLTHASQAAGTETLVGIVGKDFILLGADSSVSQSIALTASNLDKIAPLSEPFFYGTQQKIQPCIVAAAAGNAAASDRLLGMLKAQATLEEYENGWGCDVDYIGDDSIQPNPGLTVDGMANFARVVIAQSLRSQTPYPVCLLIAGMSSNPTAKSDFVAEKVQRQVLSAWNAREGGKVLVVEKEDLSSSSSAATTGEANQSSPTPLVPKLYWLDEYGSSQCIQYGAHGHGSNFLLSILDQGFKKDMTLEQAMELMKSCFQQLRTRYVINSPQPPCIKCVDVNGIRLIR